MKNFFDLHGISRRKNTKEYFETRLTGAGGLAVERIVSHGHSSPEGHWYDQELDEWVMVLEGEAGLTYEDGERLVLGKGDSVLLPAHIRHRVEYTSSPCFWLAIFGNGLRVPEDTTR